MAFADPQTVTINAVANTLPRVSTGVGIGEYAKDDQLVVLSIAQRKTSRGRMQSRASLTKTVIAPDPFNGSLNARYSAKATLALDHELQGMTLTEKKQFVEGFLAWATASSGANILRLLGGES